MPAGPNVPPVQCLLGRRYRAHGVAHAQRCPLATRYTGATSTSRLIRAAVPGKPAAIAPLSVAEQLTEQANRDVGARAQCIEEGV